MRRLIPATHHPGSEISIEDAYAGPLGSHQDRPWVGLSMVSSIDGSTVVDGNSAGLSSRNDSGVLHQLRAIADVIIVGAATVRGEGYGPPRKVGQRVGVVTRSGSVDTTTPLFTSGAGFVITIESASIDNAEAADVIRAGKDDVDFERVLTQLDRVHATPRFVQAEGGAMLNGALLDADLLDEINVTTSPLSVGGSGPRLSTGADDHAHRYELAQLIVDEQSYVYSRWLRSADGDNVARSTPHDK